MYQRNGRWWADFRDFREYGGRQEPLKPPGEPFATKTKHVAESLLMVRLAELVGIREGERPRTDPVLVDYAEKYLRDRKLSVSAGTLARERRSLYRVIQYFGAETRLSLIDADELREYWRDRREQRGYRGERIQVSTIRLELQTLGAMYAQAVREKAAARNPWADLGEGKPKRADSEAEWLEPGEARRLIDAGYDLLDVPTSRLSAHLPVVVAVGLYTGGRRGEILGLLRRDVDFDLRVIHFRRNPHRDLKTKAAKRYVPLWPECEDRVRTWLENTEGPPTDLLFPSRAGGIIRNVDEGFAAIVDRAKIDKRVTPHTLRHTFTAARLQTLDHGEPISPYTVARELGHSNIDMITKVYGHLMKNRHRSAVLEYREASVTPLKRAAESS
jgi:integrase